MSESQPADQELVFCHACQNEFYKEGSSLSCPECHSDFTEVIDPSFDPREDTEEHISSNFHNAWARDPDEMDIEDVSRGSGPRWGVDRNDPHDFTRDDPFHSPMQASLFGNFASMLTGMTGRPVAPGQYSDQNRGVGGIFHPQPGMQPPPGQFGNRTRSASGGGPRSSGPHVYTRTFPRGGGGVHISFSSSGGWRSTNTQGGEFQDLNDLFQSVLQVGGPMSTNRSEQQGQHVSPFAALFSSLLNPANAQHGDAVFSQEAFDRVMSQLMDQHTTGTAPGPASEAAIAALPRKKVTEDMLDETTHQAECSICMENVTVEEEVTVLPCQHWFHHPCVEAWLKEHDTCPICRSGIVPKDGDRNTPRTPQQVPLHDEDPFLLARRQSGTRENPFVVPESPTQERRRPGSQRHDSAQSYARRYTDNEGSSGFTGRVRSFFGAGNAQNTSDNSYSNGRRRSGNGSNSDRNNSNGSR